MSITRETVNNLIHWVTDFRANKAINIIKLFKMMLLLKYGNSFQKDQMF